MPRMSIPLCILATAIAGTLRRAAGPAAIVAAGIVASACAATPETPYDLVFVSDRSGESQLYRLDLESEETSPFGDPLPEAFLNDWLAASPDRFEGRPRARPADAPTPGPI